jgi:hypothetical protein
MTLESGLFWATEGDDEERDPEYLARLVTDPEDALLADVDAVARGIDPPYGAFAESIKGWADLPQDELLAKVQVALRALETVSDSFAARGAADDILDLAYGRELHEASAATRVLCELSPAERYLLALAAERPGDWASGSQHLYRRLENVRKRARRQMERAQRA